MEIGSILVHVCLIIKVSNMYNWKEEDSFMVTNSLIMFQWQLHFSLKKEIYVELNIP